MAARLCRPLSHRLFCFPTIDRSAPSHLLRHRERLDTVGERVPGGAECPGKLSPPNWAGQVSRKAPTLCRFQGVSQELRLPELCFGFISGSGPCPGTECFCWAPVSRLLCPPGSLSLLYLPSCDSGSRQAACPVGKLENFRCLLLPLEKLGSLFHLLSHSEDLWLIVKCPLKEQYGSWKNLYTRIEPG